MGFLPEPDHPTKRGQGSALGFTMNVPIALELHAGLFRRPTKALDKAADKIKPELVLISAGFDAHTLDRSAP